MKKIRQDQDNLIQQTTYIQTVMPLLPSHELLWGSCLAFLDLSFLSCKMGTLVVPLL